MFSLFYWLINWHFSFTFNLLHLLLLFFFFFLQIIYRVNRFIFFSILSRFVLFKNTWIDLSLSQSKEKKNFVKQNNWHRKKHIRRERWREIGYYVSLNRCFGIFLFFLLLFLSENDRYKSNRYFDYTILFVGCCYCFAAQIGDRMKLVKAVVKFAITLMKLLQNYSAILLLLLLYFFLYNNRIIPNSNCLRLFDCHTSAFIH